MRTADWESLLQRTAAIASRFQRGLPTRPVRSGVSAREALARLSGPLPERGEAPEQLVEKLAALLEPGVTAMTSGRFFGWVIGGALPGALAADWLTATYDQNVGMAEPTPAAAMAEQVALEWTRQLLRLPEGVSGALVTGAQMASTTCLLAARNALLADLGWDVEARGLRGAPALGVIVSEHSHAVIQRSLRVVGLGTDCARPVACDAQGAMRADAFAEALAACDGPVLVCAQAGNVNSGAFDPLGGIADAIAARPDDRGRTWLHVDGAFGLWARASEAHAHLAAGAERADSWATDAHKWLNTPYDCGVAFTTDPAAHRRSLSVRADYLPPGDAEDLREPMDYTPEFSRRARGIPLYAALRELGSEGVADLITRCCAHARSFATALDAAAGVRVDNEVVLNQVLVRFRDPSGRDDDAHTDAVVTAVQRQGVCFMSGTTWRGQRMMRISVSNWSTDEADVRASVDSILRQHATVSSAAGAGEP